MSFSPKSLSASAWGEELDDGTGGFPESGDGWLCLTTGYRPLMRGYRIRRIWNASGNRLVSALVFGIVQGSIGR